MPTPAIAPFACPIKDYIAGSQLQYRMVPPPVLFGF